MHEMTSVEQARAEELLALLAGPIPCSAPGQSKLGKRPALRVLLARRRFLRRLPWALSAADLRQWERELGGDEYYAAQRSIVAAQRYAAAHLGDHFLGSAA